MDNKQFTKRIIVLGSIFLLLICVYLFSSGLRTTISRYIKREQDEIKAYYTSLYFASDGEGKSLAVESNVGYVEFSLMNYIGEDVTQRDIEFLEKISTIDRNPSKNHYNAFLDIGHIMEYHDTYGGEEERLFLIENDI